MGLVILARKGDREIRWVCTDIREYRQRSKSFASQGYTIS